MESESPSKQRIPRLDPYINSVMDYLESLNLKCPGFLIPFLLERANPETNDYRYGFDDRIFCANFSITKNDKQTSEKDVISFAKDFKQLALTGENRMKVFADRLTQISGDSRLTDEQKLNAQTDLLIQLLAQLKQHPYWQKIMREISKELPKEFQIDFTTKLIIGVAYSLITMQYSANLKEHNECKDAINRLKDRKDDINQRIGDIKEQIEFKINQKPTSSQKAELKKLQKEIDKLDIEIASQNTLLDKLFVIAQQKSGFNTTYNKLKSNPAFETMLKQKIEVIITDDLTRAQTATPPTRRDLSRSSSGQSSSTAQLIREMPTEPTRLTGGKKTSAKMDLMADLPKEERPTITRKRSEAITEAGETLEQAKELAGLKGAESQESEEDSEEKSAPSKRK